MDVLNSGDEHNAGQNEIPFPGSGKWACFLGFKQSPRQKSIKGIIVACPKAARIFAQALLTYADEEDAKVAPKTVKVAAKKKKK